MLIALVYNFIELITQSQYFEIRRHPDWKDRNLRALMNITR